MFFFGGRWKLEVFSLVLFLFLFIEICCNLPTIETLSSTYTASNLSDLQNTDLKVVGIFFVKKCTLLKPYPVGSMYGISTYRYHQNQANMPSKYKQVNIPCIDPMGTKSTQTKSRHCRCLKDFPSTLPTSSKKTKHFSAIPTDPNLTELRSLPARVAAYSTDLQGAGKMIPVLLCKMVLGDGK